MAAKLDHEKLDNASPPKRPLHRDSLAAKAKALLESRKRLPIWQSADQIRRSLSIKDVVLLAGETGSGKSTQVPQFLLDEPWCTTKTAHLVLSGKQQTIKVGGCIAVTEPRRVAAITLARRVAEEMGTPLGSSSPASRVGYAVRFDNSTSPSTRIKFLTEGMLLQEMLQDPWLRQYSAIIVDEVHERGTDVDLILGFLRAMTSRRQDGRAGIPIKVIVMSATADMAELSAFFGSESQKTSEVDQGMISDESEWSGISTSSGETRKPSMVDRTRAQIHDSATCENFSSGPEEALEEASNEIGTCYIHGRQFPVDVVYSPESVQDLVEAALQTILRIHYAEPLPGDILVFLTGQETVEALEKLLMDCALQLDPRLPQLQILPLFAALPQASQQRVFQPTPRKTRKVVIATNIAETSLTVAGVRFVVDGGKCKIKQFRSRIGLDSLLVKPISKSAAAQRAGRAGREAPGKCFRLYTEHDYQALPTTNAPEILRCDLSQAILTIKARGIEDIMRFPFLTQPPREALEQALLQLLHLGALGESGGITDVGLKMARLPLTASLARTLLAAATSATNCLLEVIDIISCFSVETLFLSLTTEESKEQAEHARRSLFRREGDHLTLLATVQAYAAERVDRKTWAERHFVSHRAIQSVMDVRRQLRHHASRLQLLSASDDSPGAPLTPELGNAIIKSFLRGFAHNTARLTPDGSYKTIYGNQIVSIHPSSVLFGKKVEAIVYNEFVFTNRSYARGVTAFQMDWLEEVLQAR